MDGVAIRRGRGYTADMRDTIETLGASTIQHGPLNRRIYLMRLDPSDVPDIFGRMTHMARHRGYEKILARIPTDVTPLFESEGFVREAAIPAFFSTTTAGVFMSKFLSPDRKKDPGLQRRVTRLRQSDQKPPLAGPSPADNTESVQRCRRRDTREMSRIYRRVFDSYPFPIMDPAHLEDQMGHATVYYCIRQDGRIAALSSAEMDPDNGNAEMTDFAVLPAWRSRGFASRLLHVMEGDMRRAGIRVCYTIARVRSAGMNRVFRNKGYRWGGVLVNNTHIAGGIESMGVWYKSLGVRPHAASFVP